MTHLTDNYSSNSLYPVCRPKSIRQHTRIMQKWSLDLKTMPRTPSLALVSSN